MPNRARITAEAQRDDPGSTLSLYRAALRLLRSLEALHGAPLSWVEAGPEVLAFRRGPGFECVINFGARPGGGQLLLASVPCDAELPADTAAWFRLGR